MYDLGFYLYIFFYVNAPYLISVAISLLITRFFRPFRVRYAEFIGLLLPVCVYMFLEHVIHERQGLNFFSPRFVMALPAVITAGLGARSSKAYWAGVAITTISAIAAWLLVPSIDLRW